MITRDVKTRTPKQLEMMKDLLRAKTIHGFKGISIRKGEEKYYSKLEKDGLVYFFRMTNLSIRLTDKGLEWAWFHFAYGYQNSPVQGKTTWQDANGEVTLIS